MEVIPFEVHSFSKNHNKVWSVKLKILFEKGRTLMKGITKQKEKSNFWRVDIILSYDCFIFILILI